MSTKSRTLLFLSACGHCKSRARILWISVGSYAKHNATKRAGTSDPAKHHDRDFCGRSAIIQPNGCRFGIRCPR